MPDWKVSLYGPLLGDAEIAATTQVLRSGWLSVGAVTREFEEAFAAMAGVGDGVAVSSGTAALHLAFLALELGPGDEVVLPSFSFVSAAATATLCGATPVFADVSSANDLTVSPADVAARITERTRVIVAAHYGGYAAELPALVDLANRYGLALVEDSAHAPATPSEHGVLGTVGDVGCYSFFATKNLAMGEGGLVVAKDPELLDRVRRLRSNALTVSSQDRQGGGSSTYDVDGIGLNYRPTEIASAIGLAQLRDMPNRQLRRQEIVTRYRRELAGLPGIHQPFSDRGVTSGAHHLFPLVLSDAVSRPMFQERLARAGIQTGVHYPPTHLFTAYRERFGCCEGQLPVTEGLMDRQVSLPMNVCMTEDDVSLVVAAVRGACEEAR